VKELSKNHDIGVQVLFGSLRGRVWFGFLHIFYIWVWFSSWQNLGSSLVLSCRVLVISHL